MYPIITLFVASGFVASGFEILFITYFQTCFNTCLFLFTIKTYILTKTGYRTNSKL